MAVKGLWVFVAVVMALTSISYALKCHFLHSSGKRMVEKKCPNAVDDFCGMVLIEETMGGYLGCYGLNHTCILGEIGLTPSFAKSGTLDEVNQAIKDGKAKTVCCKNDLCNEAGKRMTCNMGFVLILPGILYLLG